MNLVFDLDGTICYDGLRIESRIKELLIVLNEKHNIVFASARPIRDMLPVLKDEFKDNDMIGANGAMYKSGDKITTNAFKQAELKNILKYCQENDIAILVDGTWDYFYNGTANSLLDKLDTDKLASNVELGQLDEIIKVVFMPSTKIQSKELLNLISEQLDCQVHHFANENYFDIVPKGINKYTSISKLLNNQAYDAFGNDHNDLELLKHARRAYIVGNDITLSGRENVNLEQLLSILKEY